MKLPNTIRLTPLKYSKNRSIAMAWKIKKFFIVVENNSHDEKAMAVYKVDKNKNEYHIGYIRKNEYVFTKEAEELYSQYQDFVQHLTNECEGNQDLAYKEAQSEYFTKEGWGEKVAVSIWTDHDILNILSSQDKYKLLTDKDMPDWELYLELKKEVK